jgi:hypothetical protein
VRNVILQSEREEWFKYGRGHVFQFYATVKDIINIIISNKLPELYSPYRLECIFKGNRDIQYSSVLPSDFDNVTKNISMENIDIYLRSEYLSPSLSLVPNVYADVTLRQNSLIEIEEAIPCMELQFPSSISVIEKWIGPQGEIFEKKEYYNLFQIIKKEIKAILKYKARLWDFGKGEWYASKDRMISEDFYSRIRNGTVSSLDIIN